MPAVEPRDRVQRFVLRARKVATHSLILNELDLLRSIAQSEFKFKFQINQKTGETKQWLQVKLPPEEAFESLAVRLRPFLMRDEPVYWENVIDAIGKLVSRETLNELVDLDDLRAEWTRATTGRRAAQAYYMLTENGQLTDFQLAELWLNSDALHTQIIKSAAGKETTLNTRYHAAAQVYSRTAACADYTLFLIWGLAELGLLELDDELFTVPVLAETETDLPAQAFALPAGAASLPTSMSEWDTSEWDPLHLDKGIQRALGNAPCNWRPKQ